MPAVKNVGEPCAGEPHARIDGGREETRNQSATPREPRRLSPTRPPSLPIPIALRGPPLRCPIVRSSPASGRVSGTEECTTALVANQAT